MAYERERKSEVRPVAARRRSKMLSAKSLLILLLVLILAAGLGFFAYKYNQANNEAKRLADPKAAAAKQTSDLVNQVSKLVELPAGEIPTIATVTDVSKLQNQAFFKAAKNDDKVLIYTRAKKAILYRPSEGKVIEIAPLNIGSSQGTTTQTPSK